MKNEINVKYSACVVLINQEGLVLGVSRKDNLESFGLPGGKMEDIDNDEPKFTAIRETFEETGLQISNLRLVFAMCENNHMCYCYIADYKGEINHYEPHIVKWVPFDKLIKGSFGEYNTMVSESLKNMGVKYKLHLELDDLRKELEEYINSTGYLFSNLRRTKDWFGMDIIELTFYNADGSYIDGDLCDFNIAKEVDKISKKYDMKVKIPSEYYPK